MKSMRGWKLWQMRIWHLFFRPSSSFYAKVSRDYVSLYVYASCVSYTLCNWRIQESLAKLMQCKGKRATALVYRTHFRSLNFDCRLLAEERPTISTLSLKSTFSAQQSHWQCGSIFIRLADVVFQICEIAQNSEKIWTCSSSRSSKVFDLSANRKRICSFLLIISSNFGRISYRFRDIDA